MNELELTQLRRTRKILSASTAFTRDWEKLRNIFQLTGLKDIYIYECTHFFIMKQLNEIRNGKLILNKLTEKECDFCVYIVNKYEHILINMQ